MHRVEHRVRESGFAASPASPPAARAPAHHCPCPSCCAERRRHRHYGGGAPRSRIAIAAMSVPARTRSRHHRRRSILLSRCPLPGIRYQDVTSVGKYAKPLLFQPPRQPDGYGGRGAPCGSEARRASSDLGGGAHAGAAHGRVHLCSLARDSALGLHWPAVVRTPLAVGWLGEHAGPGERVGTYWSSLEGEGGSLQDAGKEDPRPLLQPAEAGRCVLSSVVSTGTRLYSRGADARQPQSAPGLEPSRCRPNTACAHSVLICI